MDELESIVASQHVSIGVITTPPGAAQQVCDRLVEAGVTSILNFAPTVLNVPDGVDVRKVDLSIELQILAFHEQRKSGEEPEEGPIEEPPVRERAPGPVRAAAAKLRRAAGGGKDTKGDSDRQAVLPA